MKTPKNKSNASDSALKAILITILLLCPVFSAKAQYSQQWVAGLNTSVDPYARTNMLVDVSNNQYVFGGNVITKFSANGSIMWTKTLTDRVHAFVLDASGNLYAAGQKYTTNSYSIFFKKYSNNGTELLSVLDSAGMYQSFYPLDITVDNSGNIYIFANDYLLNQFHTNSSELIKYNSAGNKIWNRSFSLTSGIKMIKDNSGNLLICGGVSSYYGGFPSYSLVQRVDQAGNTLNTCKLDSGYVSDITIDNAGNIYAAGRSTMKISAGWNKEWEVMNGFYARSLEADNSGNVFIAGQHTIASVPGNAATAKLNAAGQIMWVQYVIGVTGGSNAANDIQLLPGGDILVCGLTERTSGNKDFFLTKYTSAGSLLHTTYFNSAGDLNDEAKCLRLTSGSNLVVSGTSGNSTYGDIILIKFADVTGITVTSGEVPSDFSLNQNYPNPFNPSTKISFSIPAASFVKLAVYDAAGREVEVLLNEHLNAGTFNADFNAAGLTSGVYFCKITAGSFTDVKKMMLVK